jgi:hypothetical protein
MALALLAMPFCWSFGRDVIAIALANDRDERSAIHAHLVRSLMQSQTWATRQGEWRGQELRTTMIVLPRCYEVSSSALRNGLGDGEQAEAESETTLSWSLSYLWAADSTVDGSVEFQQALRAFGPLEASMLRSCIESSLLSRACASRRTEQFDASRRLSDWNDLHRRLGTRRRVIDASGRFRGHYCDTMPQILE